MTIHKAALAVTLLVGATGPVLAQGYGQPTPPPPAPAQAPGTPAPPAGQQPAQPTRQYNLTRQERQVFQPVIAAVTAGDWATATTGLAAAAPQATSNDAKYLVGQIRLQIGINTQNRAFQSQGIDEMIASCCFRTLSSRFAAAISFFTFCTPGSMPRMPCMPPMSAMVSTGSPPECEGLLPDGGTGRSPQCGAAKLRRSRC